MNLMPSKNKVCSKKYKKNIFNSTILSYIHLFHQKSNTLHNLFLSYIIIILLITEESEEEEEEKEPILCRECSMVLENEEVIICPSCKTYVDPEKEIEMVENQYVYDDAAHEMPYVDEYTHLDDEHYFAMEADHDAETAII